MNTLFLAWQDPSNRCWYTIGKLTSQNGLYRFMYTQGVHEAQEKGDFTPFPYFPDLASIYESPYLFPIFANRLPSRTRPDFTEYVQWLSLPENEYDPIALLARSGGKRATDTFEVFPCPELEDDGLYHLHFFVHGLRHRSLDTINRAANLQPGEQLLLMQDIQNPFERFALALRTAEKTPGDMHIIGYCPRYLLDDLHSLIEKEGAQAIEVRVERVNSSPAPIQFRVLCNLTMKWPAGFKPFAGDMFHAMADEQEESPLIAAA